MAEGENCLDLVLCELCEDKPAKFYCRTCAGNMCKECKEDHKRKKMFHRHDVVRLTITRQLELEGFGYCNVHPESKYELNCQSCQIPVCTKCIVAEHNGHKMEEISTAYLESQHTISEIINEVKDHLIPTYRRSIQDLEAVLGDVKKQTRDLEQTVIHRTKYLADFICSIEKDVLQEIHADERTYSDQIVAGKKEVESHLSFLQRLQSSLIEEQGDKSMTDSILYLKNKLELAERKKSFQMPSFQPAYFIGNDTFEKTMRNLFGLLLPSKMVIQKSKRIFLVKAKEIKNIKTTIKSPVGLCVSDQNQAVWVRGYESRVHKMEMRGKVLEKITTQTKIGRPSGLIEMEDGNILFTDLENKKIIKVAKNLQEKGEINTGWYPMGLCITLSGHILVCVAYLSVYKTNETDVGKILRMNCQGDIYQEIKKNSVNENLYVRPICISENINQDICVSDTMKNSVIVVDRTGIFRFAYGGGFIKNDDRIFGPAELDTDKDGNILISDEMNSLVHLLDIDGRFLKYILTTEDGVSKPRGLKVDDEDRLWLTEIKTQSIKVFQYLK